MNSKQKSLLDVHGLQRRYGNLEQQCALSLSSSSSTLNPHYNLRKEFLEHADVFCSVGIVEKERAVFASLSPLKHEYFTRKAEKSSDNTENELSSVLEALNIWAEDHLHGQKVALVTTNDQVYALLEHTQEPRNDTKISLMEEIQKEIAKYKIELMTFSVSDICILRLVCENEDKIDGFIEDKMGSAAKVNNVGNKQKREKSAPVHKHKESEGCAHCGK